MCATSGVGALLSETAVNAIIRRYLRVQIAVKCWFLSLCEIRAYADRCSRVS